MIPAFSYSQFRVHGTNEVLRGFFRLRLWQRMRTGEVEQGRKRAREKTASAEAWDIGSKFELGEGGVTNIKNWPVPDLFPDRLTEAANALAKFPLANGCAGC